MTQVLTSGPTLSAQYGRWGVSNQRMVPLPSKLFGLFLGMSNTGKTSLIASNPGALIVNCDISSTPSPSPSAPPWPAQFWPAINSEGRTVDQSGAVVTLRWEEIDSLADRLVEASRSNSPRPEMVALDSIATAIALLRDWVVRKFGKKDFRELDGRMAYDAMYDQLLQFAAKLRRAGYGVYFLGHLRNNTIPLGDDRYVIKLDLDVTDGFWKRVYPLCEFIACTYKERKTRIKKVEHTVGGRTVVLDQPESYWEYGLIFNNEELQGILKSRLKLPEALPLPENNAWDALCKAYDAAILPPPAST
jgi:hypothetical protein